VAPGEIVPGDLIVVAGHRSLSDGQGVRLQQ